MIEPNVEFIFMTNGLHVKVIVIDLRTKWTVLGIDRKSAGYLDV